ncbi:hypothetical protein C8R42DRAFT_32333 [Lentinula raphanica]|nr:hypothetical protein C8R42DRAFT_32333 [Lentinula raphanica]
MHVFRASSPWYSFVVNMLLISIITTAISSPIPVSSSLSKSQPRPGKVVKQQKPKIRKARLLPSQSEFSITGCHSLLHSNLVLPWVTQKHTKV